MRRRQPLPPRVPRALNSRGGGGGAAAPRPPPARRPPPPPPPPPPPQRPRAATEEDAAKDDDEGAPSAAAYVAPIATPLAGKKLTKKTLKVVKKAAGGKFLRRGVKEVVKALRKGEKGCVSRRAARARARAPRSPCGAPRRGLACAHRVRTSAGSLTRAHHPLTDPFRPRAAA